MNRSTRSLTNVFCLCVAIAFTPPALAQEDRANPFVGSKNKEETKTDGSFFGLFGSDETEFSEFERPSAGYGALMARRPDAIRMQNARGSGLVDAPQAEEYVNDVLRKILVANGLADLAPRAYLHADLDAQAVTTPDGGIFINIGLIHSLQTETELAFLLAHEVSHFLLQHHDADWFVKTESRMLTGIDTLQTIGSGIAQKVGKSDSAMGKKLQRATQIGALIYDVSDNVFFSAWGREQEQEADRMGLDLIVGAGYYPFDAEGVLEIIAKQEELLEQNRENSKALLDTRSAEAFGLTDEDVAANPLLGEAANGVGQMINELGSDHYPAAERSDDMYTYNEKHYGDVMPGHKSAVPWVQVADDPVNVIVTNYGFASQALEDLSKGEISKAEKSARKAVDGPTEHHAYPRVVFQKVRRAQNNKSKAEANLKLAQGGDTVPILVYYEYIDLQNEQRQYTGILDLVAKAQKESGGAIPQFLPYEVYAYRALGDQRKAFDLQKSCELDQPEMQRSCKRASQGDYPGTPPVTPQHKKVDRTPGFNFGPRKPK